MNPEGGSSSELTPEELREKKEQEFQDLLSRPRRTQEEEARFRDLWVVLGKEKLYKDLEKRK